MAELGPPRRRRSTWPRGMGAVGSLLDASLREAAVFHVECLFHGVRAKLERLLAMRARFIDASPIVVHSGRFLSVIERTRDEGLVLVLNAHPEQTMGASVEVSPALAGRRLLRDGLPEARAVSASGSVFVEAPPMSYALYVTERLPVTAPLLRREELVSSARALRRSRPAHPTQLGRDVPLGWVQAILGAA